MFNLILVGGFSGKVLCFEGPPAKTFINRSRQIYIFSLQDAYMNTGHLRLISKFYKVYFYHFILLCTHSRILHFYLGT